MIEVFKINVQENQIANDIIGQLLRQFPESKVNFDLEDCDKVLRIDTPNMITQFVINTLHKNSFYCE